MTLPLDRIFEPKKINSSNYILATYLSDIESKFILCYFCVFLANLSF